MELVKKTKDHVIYKKRSGRFAVLTQKKTYVNGEDKTKVLLAAGLVKALKAKAKPADEAPSPAEATEATPAEPTAATDTTES